MCFHRGFCEDKLVILKCRVCNCSDLKSIVSLGFTPLANALLTKEQLDKPEEKYPLDLVFCPNCTLVQIVETVPPEKLFSDYFYVSSISKTTLENAKKISNEMIDRLKLNESSRVVEIGSNDGYLLKNYVEKGIWVCGYEPAKNLADEANSKGIRTFNQFFNVENVNRFVKGEYLDRREESYNGVEFKVDVIHANNVLAHVADLHGVVEGIRMMLKPEGLAVIETHYVKDLINSTQFDCIYHEHLCYYSALSLCKLFQMHGMEMVDVERTEMHGGTLRAFFQLKDSSVARPASYEKVRPFLEDEQKKGVYNLQHYQSMIWNIERMRSDLLSFVNYEKIKGKSIAVYGCTAKSTTLLNYFGINKDVIDWVVDATPNKQNHYTPGTHIPIIAPGGEEPDFYLLLAWNFKDEILKKEQAFRDKGGKFIIPIPRLEIV